jgi:CHAT domain-containing protein
MNACHSAQGEALPASGSLGLNRAWIAAGARAVLSTFWDVPDDSRQSLMVHFYASLRGASQGNPALALREAQIRALHSGGPENMPARWAGYFLLSRIR